MNNAIHHSILVMLSLIAIVQAVYNPIFLSVLFVITITVLYSNFKNNKKTARTYTFGFIIFSLVTIYLSYQSFIGVEAGVALLTTFLFAKALETRTKRDIIILFNFALFVSASTFLYSQNIWVTFVTFLCLFSCFVGLFRLQTIEFDADRKSQFSLKQDMGHVLKFVLYAIPFFILLFLFFPRLPPLWHIPIPDQKGVTGISDKMSPGDIAQLSQSSVLAFRIIGDVKDLPPRSELYWRGLVLDQYDGQEWTSHDSNHQPISLSQNEFKKSQLNYRYLANDPTVNWVMSLEKSIPDQDKYILRSDWSIVPQRMNRSSQPISLTRLSEESSENKKFLYPKWVQKLNTRLPEYSDPKAQNFAQEMFAKSHREPSTYVQNILDWYKQNQFVYTLSPGLLGQNRIDEFLFKSKQGFCEHYASSFVMLMRYVGIPARIVVGYQGGQVAPDGESWEVRQLDAHAWTEVLLDDKWVRFDPTAIIAPQRIDNGMQNLISENREVLGDQTSEWKYQQISMLNKVRVWGDYVSYQWQSKVVGYDAEQQKKWFDQLGFHSAYSAILVIFFGTGFLIILYLSVSYFLRIQKMDDFDRIILKISKNLSQNLKRENTETVAHWLVRISEYLPIEYQEHFLKTAKAYNSYMFASSHSKNAKAELKIMFKTCSDAISKLKNT